MGTKNSEMVWTSPIGIYYVSSSNLNNWCRFWDFWLPDVQANVDVRQFFVKGWKGLTLDRVSDWSMLFIMCTKCNVEAQSAMSKQTFVFILWLFTQVDWTVTR